MNVIKVCNENDKPAYVRYRYETTNKIPEDRVARYIANAARAQACIFLLRKYIGLLIFTPYSCTIGVIKESITAI
jgi:hypothetical protein